MTEQVSSPLPKGRDHDFRSRKGSRYIRSSQGYLAVVTNNSAFWIGWHGDHWSTAVILRGGGRHQMCFHIEQGQRMTAVLAYRMTMAWLEKGVLGVKNQNSPFTIMRTDDDEMPVREVAPTVH